MLGPYRVVVTVSHYNREAILRMAPKVYPQRVRVLANGIDIDRFNARPHDPHRPFRFAGTGRLVEIKGFHVLIEAVGLLGRKRRDFKVSLIGEGPSRPEFEGRITELGIGDSVGVMGRRDASFLETFLPEQDWFLL